MRTEIFIYSKEAAAFSHYRQLTENLYYNFSTKVAIVSYPQSSEDTIITIKEGYVGKMKVIQLIKAGDKFVLVDGVADAIRLISQETQPAPKEEPLYKGDMRNW